MIEIQKEEIFKKYYSKHDHLFIDLSREDSKNNFLDSWVKNEEKVNEKGNLSPDVSIGMRIAAKYFFNLGLNSFISYISQQDIPRFNLNNVLQLIGEEYKKKNEILLLTIQIDEFQKFEEGQMTLEMGTFMSKYHDFGVQIVPFLSGTGNKGVIKTLDVSSFRGIEIILEPCTNQESIEMIQKSLILKNDFIQYENQILNDSISLCGNIPRLNEYFVKSINGIIETKNSLIDFNTLMNQMQKNIVKLLSNKYDSKAWDELLGQENGKSGTGISKMCFFSLIKKEVTLHDKLNGFTVEKAKNAGVIYLEKLESDIVKSPSSTKYNIVVPLVLLDYFNDDYKMVDSKVLHPYEDKNWNSFEEIMMIYRKILSDIAIKTGIKKIKFKELFGNELLGYEDDLNTFININPFEIINISKLDQKINSIDEYSNTKIQISLVHNIDITKGEHFVRNIPMAPSFDSILFHKKIVEIYQYKSSDYISSGKPPSIKHDNCINVKLLNEEYKKATKSNEFFGERNIKFILISNKPFWNYSKIKTELKNGKSKFPKHVMVICNNNFEKCIAKPFYSWKGLFIPAKSITCCKCKDCNKSTKCSCKKENESCNGECECNCNEEKKRKRNEKIEKEMKRSKK